METGWSGGPQIENRGWNPARCRLRRTTPRCGRSPVSLRSV